MKPLIKIYKEGSDFRATVSVPERWGHVEGVCGAKTDHGAWIGGTGNTPDAALIHLFTLIGQLWLKAPESEQVEVDQIAVDRQRLYIELRKAESELEISERKVGSLEAIKTSLQAHLRELHDLVARPGQHASSDEDLFCCARDAILDLNATAAQSNMLEVTLRELIAAFASPDAQEYGLDASNLLLAIVKAKDLLKLPSDDYSEGDQKEPS